MKILYWVLVAWMVIGTVLIPGMVGQERKPITKGNAIFAVAVNVLMIFALAVAAWR